MPPSLAASLPADVLARIFAATEVKNRCAGELDSVLSCEERTRAEASGGVFPGWGHGGWRHEIVVRGIKPTLQQRAQTPHNAGPLPPMHRV